MRVGNKRIPLISIRLFYAMSNGCGCENGLFKFIKPPYARLFHLPCCLHDDEYDIGGDSNARRIADRNLFTRCVKTIHRNENNPWRMMWLFHIAMMYYVCVRAFGFMYFNKNISQ